MILNHASNPALFANTVDHNSNPKLMKTLSRLLSTIHNLSSVDSETRSTLYEAAVDAVFESEANAFDRACEIQHALDSDEMTVHEE